MIEFMKLVFCTICHYEEAFASYPGMVPRLALYRVVEPILEAELYLCERHYQQLHAFVEFVSVTKLDD